MHDAYQLQPILKLPLNIESVTSYGEYLMVGTKQGHLLMYSIRRNSENDSEPQVQLMRSNKYFSKKPIVQLQVIEEYSILIALTDNIISVHDVDLAVTNFPTICTVNKSRGANLFSVDVVRQKSLTGENACTIRMVVSVKRKLQFYYWKNRKFHEFRDDLNVPDIPKSLAWCKDSVCIGFKGEYSLIRLGGKQELCELFPTGKNQEAMVKLMLDEKFALSKDEQTTFLDFEGNMKLHALSWEDVPVNLTHDPPYLIAVLPRGIEIKTDEPRLSIQKIELNKPKFITSSLHGIVYVASQNQIWCLQMNAITTQVQNILKQKQFELAILLTTICKGNHEEKTKRIQKIKTLYGFDLFNNKKFKDAMNIFYQLDIDASHVIGLFSDMLPQEYRNKILYPDKLVVLQGREIENGLIALIEYLTKVRHKLQGSQSSEIAPFPIHDHDKCVKVKSKKQLLQIIDTTLLKCYLRTNDALVAPLLRLNENHCHLEEAERALIKSERLSELIILYNNRGLHHKALDLLYTYHDNKDSSLFGIERSIQYLQNLGPNHLDIIFKFSPWILDKNSSEGLKIFIGDLIEVEGLPRTKVLEFLIKSKPSLVTPYLEHIIYTWNEDKAVFLDAIIVQYKNILIDPSCNADQYATIRNKLQNLLMSSCNYSAMTLLAQFPMDTLFQERAILLGKVGKHEDALIIYLYILQDFDRAILYCHDTFALNEDVFNMLLTLLAHPPKLSYFETNKIPISDIPKANLMSVVMTLKEHGRKMNHLHVLKKLPQEMRLKELRWYIINGIESKVNENRKVQLLRALLHAEHLQAQEERVSLESGIVTLSEFELCRVCHKKFGNCSAFVRCPNGEIMHFSCQEKN